ncbi:MAG: hypothetical protein ACKO24_12865 [Leptolyngbyaceae cyanobacterium]
MEDYAQNIALEDKAKVRNALYQHPGLIDAFLTENPQGFSEDQLAIVAQWKKFIKGKFYIERKLKKYTIFIRDNDAVYGVLGLQSDFDEMFYPSQLPLLVEAVLLPFKDVIIYDGLLQGYNIFFGGGISGDLKEIYLRAKQRGEIIESLTSKKGKPVTSPPGKAMKDWTSEIEELVAKASKLRGGSGQPSIYSPVFSLIKASLELGQAAVVNPNDDQHIGQLLGKVEQAMRKVERTLYR